MNVQTLRYYERRGLLAELLEAGRHRNGRPVAGLQDRVAAKLAEVDAKIADLTAIRTALATDVEAGCDDLTVCASIACCPIPFTGLAQETPAGRPLRDRRRVEQ